MYGVFGSNIWPEMMPGTEGFPIGGRGVSLGQNAAFAYHCAAMKTGRPLPRPLYLLWMSARASAKVLGEYAPKV